MSSSDNDQQTELLKGIAASLKGIHSSLESLTAAVEDVSESIEKAHEPEGDLGVHLVGALKDLVSALHKKANQERSTQPQQNQQRHQHQQGRRQEERRQHPNRAREENRGEGDRVAEEAIESGAPVETAEAPAEQDAQKALEGNRGPGRGRRGGRSAKQKKKE